MPDSTLILQHEIRCRPRSVVTRFAPSSPTAEWRLRYLGRLHGADGFERPVALKVIKDQFLQNREFVTMFMDEAKIVSRVSHPNIVQLYELGNEKDRLFIAMELLVGQSLWNVWQACRGTQRVLASRF